MHDTVAKLSINRLIIIPFTIHPVLQTPFAAKPHAALLIACSASYGDIVNYNTRSRASSFSKTFSRQFEGPDKGQLVGDRRYFVSTLRGE
jgi:hypothetical protein